MVQSYTKRQLDNIAHDNYEILRTYCGILEREGYWEGPKSVLKQSIYAMLDMYVQTVLIRLALFCGRLGHDEIRFIADLPDINIYELDSMLPVESRVLSQTERFFESPPILLQLCGLRDKNRETGILGLFFDALLNIQLAMAFSDSVKTGLVAGFIRDYYSRVEAFLGTETEYGAIVDERYIFKKLCSESFDKSAQYLKEAGQSFIRYRQLYLADSENHHEETSAVSVPAPVETVKIKVVEPDPKPEPEPKPEEKKVGELERLLSELDDLVGLTAVKEEVRSLINLIKVRNLRKQHHMPLMDMSYHMVFTGNPGTGKTTVARLIAAIYRELGLLSKGTLIETDRSGLVAGYVGQTAIKVREVVNKALGGVLFIDEAYSLSSQCANDFGDEAIETLVKMMEDHRDDLVVIVAGYKDEMQTFLKSNTGLTSRFNKFIEFEDYSDDELVEIMMCMAVKAGFVISKDAVAKVRNILTAMSQQERTDFGNARGIRNLFERIVINQANRISSVGEPDIETLSLITIEDVRK